MIKEYKLLAFSGREDFSIEVKIEVTKNDIILHYTLIGDLSTVEIPLPSINVRNSREYNLWETTCFEFFLKKKNTTIYREFNFSPSKNWNAYYFHQYRSKLIEDDGINHIESYISNKNDEKLTLVTSIVVLPEDFSLIEYEMNITTVLKLKNGLYEYFALKHPVEKPDFHDFDCFIDLKRDR